MFDSVRNKTNLLPVALVLGAISGVFFVESGVKIASPALAANVLSSAPADDAAPTQADLSNIMKFDDRFYRVSADDSVDMNAYASATVKKISGGKVNNIEIASTSTGTYSTDGLVSDHVLYPGITVEEVHPILVATNFSIVYWPLEQTNKLRGYFSDFDLFVNDDATNGCHAETSYIVCK